VNELNRCVDRIASNQLFVGVLFFPINGEVERGALELLAIVRDKVLDGCHLATFHVGFAMRYRNRDATGFSNVRSVLSANLRNNRKPVSNNS
jgi:hypothetical protein